jgi:hypothetical protein
MHLVSLWKSGVTKWKISSKLTAAALVPAAPMLYQQTPRTPNLQQNRSTHTLGAPVRNTTPVHPNDCFKCGELGHYANNCPKRGMQTPQKDNGQRFGQPSSQMRHGSANSQINKGQRNYVRGKVNHVTAEQAQDVLVLCWVRFLSTLCLQRFYLILEHHIHSLLNNLWQIIIYL